MRNYITTVLALGCLAFAAAAALRAAGAYDTAADWLAGIYAARGILAEESPASWPWLGYLVMAALAIGVVWCVVDVPRSGQRILAAVAAALVAAGLSPTLALHGVIFEPFSLLSAVLLAAATGLFYARTERGRRKHLLESVLDGRASRAVFAELMDAAAAPDFSGKEREATVLTCRLLDHEDLRGALDPAAWMKLSNLFLRSVSQFLVSRGAYLDVSAPDQVRALFGVLQPGGDHARRACAAALELRSRLKLFHEECETRWFRRAACGTGLASGSLGVGVYGTSRDYRLGGIGGAVDLSRRLARANLRYGSGVLIEPETLLRAGEDFAVRPMEMFYDPETGAMTEIYELLAETKSWSEGEEARRDLFWKGVVHFRAKRYEEALDHFSRCRTPGTEDGPASFFLALTQEALAGGGEGDSKTRELTEDGHARLIRLI